MNAGTGLPNQFSKPKPMPTVLVQQEPVNMWQLIEIPVGVNGVQKIPFPDIQQLRSMQGQVIIIKGMELVTPKVLTNGMTTAGVNAPLTELQKMSMVIFSEGWQRGQMMPLLKSNCTADADATTATTIPYENTPLVLADWQNVDWPQSFIQLANGTVTAGAPYVIMFWVTYLKLNANNEVIVSK
jgi:hypothetical protein